MKFKISILALFIFFTTTNCDTKDDLYVPESLQINDFVWKGMNLYYLWQNEVTNLQDERFANQDDLNNFLTNYSNPKDLFNSLRVDNSIDRFSVIFDNYETLEGILSGTTLNNGVDFGLKFKAGSTTDLFGWVRYIIPNSDAATKNISRGTIFYAINGTSLTISNYQELLKNVTQTLNLADYDNGNISPNGQSVTVTKTNLSENPVLISNVINQGNKKIGYLVYNGFFPNYESQLNTAFANLKSQQITDLVLDLRYNSGGSISTATRLASMITGQFTNQVFAREVWNAKLQAYWNATNPNQLIDNFTDKLANGSAIASLNLTKIYVLTSKSTASASELVINGLKPYINVIQIGDVTTGKNVGSITLYDSPNFGKANRSSKHKYAMQPIVLKTVNNAGFGDYQNGLQPNFLLTENLSNLGILGNTDEPLLNVALNQIMASGKVIPQSTSINLTDFDDVDFLEFGMYSEVK
ncbi:S41 family peptidase [Flavobacterium sp.]|uniref:S41 family peptidase n=1 Tax=Flavobacterium sp. TaxID=239 RepID=UPI00374FF2EE